MSRPAGERVLRTWGVARPDPAQSATAAAYLRERRVLYVVCLLGVPPLAGLLTPTVPGVDIFVPLLVGLLIAELLPALRPAGGVRVASLTPRGWRDLVPGWAVAAAAVLTALVVIWSVVGLLAQPWSARAAGYLDGLAAPPWLAIAFASATLLVTGLVVWRVVRRPPAGDEAVSAALRLRTARVAVGIALCCLGGAVTVAVNRVGMLLVLREIPGAPAPPAWLVPGLDVVGDVVGPVAMVGSALAWVVLGTPTRRTLARAGR